MSEPSGTPRDGLEVPLESGQEVTLDMVLEREGKVFEFTADDGVLPSSLWDYIPLVPKSYLCITKNQILELTGMVLQQGWYTVGTSVSLRKLEKLNFRRSEYIKLHYKGGTSSRYTMKESQYCAKALQTQMKNIGKVGKTSLTPRKANITAAARNLFQRAKEFEQEFNANPSHSVVLQMVNTLREATELMGEVTGDDEGDAGDQGYREIVTYFQGLLRRPDVMKVLDSPPDTVKSGDYSKDATSPVVADEHSVLPPSDPDAPDIKSTPPSQEAITSNHNNNESSGGHSSSRSRVNSSSGGGHCDAEGSDSAAPAASAVPAVSLDSDKLHADLVRSTEKLAQADPNLMSTDEMTNFEFEVGVDHGSSDGDGNHEGGGDDEEFELDVMLGSLQAELDAITTEN